MTEPLPEIVVVAAIIRDRENRLCLSRRPEHKHQGGLWEFPGGKVEEGEPLERALARELDEELGMQGARSQHTSIITSTTPPTPPPAPAARALQKPGAESEGTMAHVPSNTPTPPCCSKVLLLLPPMTGSSMCLRSDLARI